MVAMAAEHERLWHVRMPMMAQAGCCLLTASTRKLTPWWCTSRSLVHHGSLCLALTENTTELASPMCMGIYSPHHMSEHKHSKIAPVSGRDSHIAPRHAASASRPCNPQLAHQPTPPSSSCDASASGTRGRRRPRPATPPWAASGPWLRTCPCPLPPSSRPRRRRIERPSCFRPAPC